MTPTSLLKPAVVPGQAARVARVEMSNSAALAAYLQRQADALGTGVQRLRDGDQSAVHPTRVASRRYRSTLTSFPRAFDAARAGVVVTELRWLAEVLGEVRDREVLRETLAGYGESEPWYDAALGRLAGELDQAWAEAQAQLGNPRCDQLLELAVALTEQTPVDIDAEHRAERTIRRFRLKVHAAVEHSDPEHWHDARKAAKRARYAAEALAIGGAAPESVKVFEHLQDLLGEYQDLILAEEFLAGLGIDTGSPRAAIAARREVLISETLSEVDRLWPEP